MINLNDYFTAPLSFLTKKISQEKDEMEKKEKEYYSNQHLPKWQGKGEEVKKNTWNHLTKVWKMVIY